MSLGDVELHNVAETERTDEGVQLRRVPETVREAVNDRSAAEYRRPDGVEIRFVSDDPVTVTLSADGQCEVTPFWGPFQPRPDEQVTVGTEPTTIELSLPDRVAAVDRSRLPEGYFDPAVGRLVLFGDPVTLHDVSGDASPPRPAELPDRTLLTYGTSITQGAFASRYPLSFGHLTARKSRMDHLNLGSGGSAFCDRAIADHIAGRTDWDEAVLSVSVNMLAVGFSAAEFRERASYLIETIAGEHPSKPIAAVTLFPLFAELCPDIQPDDEWDATAAEYRDVLGDVVDASEQSNVRLIEGPSLLENPGGLSTDLLHPMDHGMIEMGANLADRLTAD